MSLDFSTFYMLVDGDIPSAEDLNPVFATPEDEYFGKDTQYLISKKILDDKYYWLFARYGKSFPYSSTVYNTDNQVEEDNPRRTYQIEPHNQLFALYSINSQILYLSNLKKKSWLEEYLKARLERNVVIRTFYKSADDFIKQIKSVGTVKFGIKKDMFSQKAGVMDIVPHPKDFWGFDMPERFLLETHFSHAKLTDRFIAQFKEMVGRKNNNELESLVCIGYNEENIATIYNVDNFIQKVSVDARKNNEGLYDPDTVQQALIGKIGGF